MLCTHHILMRNCIVAVGIIPKVQCKFLVEWYSEAP